MWFRGALALFFPVARTWNTEIDYSQGWLCPYADGCHSDSGGRAYPCVRKAACFEHHLQSDNEKTESLQKITVRDDLDNFLRCQTTHDRAYTRAAAELAKRRKERAAQERGFVSQRRAEKKEKQQDELFEIRKTSAQLTIELKQITILEKIAGGRKSLRKVA